MKIQIDFNQDDWSTFANTIPEDAYRILEEYWEDCDEWAIIEVLDPKWQQWVRLHGAHWICE